MNENATIEVLVNAAELMGIRYFQLNATIADESHTSEELAALEDVEFSPSFKMKIGVDSDANQFLIRLIAKVESKIGTVIVDAGAEYSLGDSSELHIDEIPEDLMLDFVNNVSVMHLSPYIRQSIADLSHRVFGNPVTLPIMRRGELTFGD